MILKPTNDPKAFVYMWIYKNGIEEYSLTGLRPELTSSPIFHALLNFCLLFGWDKVLKMYTVGFEKKFWPTSKRILVRVLEISVSQAHWVTSCATNAGESRIEYEISHSDKCETFREISSNA